MARVSISKAATLAGVSRATLYKTYINKGEISVSSDTNGKKYIDTSEIIRVFGNIESNTVDSKVDNESDTTKTESDTLPIQVELLEKQLNEAKKREELLRQDFSERESFYQGQIKELTTTIKLLEPPKGQHAWWQFWK